MNRSTFSGLWPWKYFKPSEVACTHCGELWAGESMPLRFRDSMDALERLRGIWGKAIVTTSGHRCRSHNKAVGGVEASEHLRVAFDCVCPAPEQAAFAAAAKAAGFTGIGLYPGRGFVHLDLGPTRTWQG